MTKLLRLPVSFRVEILNGMTAPLFLAGTVYKPDIPHEQSLTFTTFENEQTVIELHVVQGEVDEAKQNKSYGKYWIYNVAPEKRGEAQVEVTFHLLNSTFGIRAMDQKTGNPLPIKFEMSNKGTHD